MHASPMMSTPPKPTAGAHKPKSQTTVKLNPAPKPKAQTGVGAGAIRARAHLCRRSAAVRGRQPHRSTKAHGPAAAHGRQQHLSTKLPPTDADGACRTSSYHSEGDSESASAMRTHKGNAENAAQPTCLSENGYERTTVVEPPVLFGTPFGQRWPPDPIEI